MSTSRYAGDFGQPLSRRRLDPLTETTRAQIRKSRKGARLCPAGALAATGAHNRVRTSRIACLSVAAAGGAVAHTRAPV